MSDLPEGGATHLSPVTINATVQDSYSDRERTNPNADRTEDSPLIIPTAVDSDNGKEKIKSTSTTVHTISTGSQNGTERGSDWLPFTLQLTYLIPLAVTAVLLGILTLTLTLYSQYNNGIGTEIDSKAFYFVWNYLPTILAVIYVLAVDTMTNDLRRTQIFARLSSPTGAPASESILTEARSWYHDVFDAFDRKQHNGRISWALFCSAIFSVFNLIAISPLSAGLFSSVPVGLESDATFQTFNRLSLPANVEEFLPMDYQDAILFRTVSGALINTSTSAWIKEEYAILPFWPVDSKLPLGPAFPRDDATRQWVSQTMAYKTELSCVELVSQTVENITVTKISPGLGPEGLYKVETGAYLIGLDFGDNCQINLTVANYSSMEWAALGGGMWFKGPDYSNVGSDFKDEKGVGNATSSTEYCGNRSLLFANQPYRYGSPWEFKAHICKSLYFEANVSATIEINSFDTTVSFDAKEFQRNKKEMNPTEFGIPLIEENFSGPIWDTKFPNAGAGGDILERPIFRGPFAALAGLPQYNSDPQKITETNSSQLLQDAVLIQQRYFGEMLLGALAAANDSPQPVQIDVPGRILKFEHRIASTLWIGLVLSIALIMSSFTILGIAYYTRLSRRPLHLYHEPAKVATVAALIAKSSPIRAHFDGCDRMRAEELSAHLDSLTFYLKNNTLSSQKTKKLSSMTTTSTSKAKRDPRPTVMRSWMAICIVLILAITAGGMAGLKEASKNGGLSSSRLTFEVEVASFQLFATYAILPTLVATLIKLLFSAVEETLRRFQPLASMLNQPGSLHRTILVEYVNTPSVLTSFKAIKYSHWMLFWVGLLAFASDILTVSMGALFAKEQTIRARNLDLTKQLELRTVPEIYLAEVPNSVWSTNTEINVLNNLYSSFLTGWLYTAAVEIVQAAPSPPWSKDIWSFAPIDLTEYNPSEPGVSSNITVDTQAIRARLECTTNTFLANTSNWLTKIDFKNSLKSYENVTLWNSTNSPPGLDVGFRVFNVEPSSGRNLICCGNETSDGVGEAAIGYWTIGSYSDSNVEDESLRNTDPNYKFTTSMVAKWLVGKSLKKLYQPADEPDWRGSTFVWTEEPKLLALTCKPIIEKANATVTVDVLTGTVKRFNITDDIVPAIEAWADDYVWHNLSGVYEDHPLANQSMVTFPNNYTTSYGVTFWGALLQASTRGDVGRSSSNLMSDEVDENLEERTFNFRMRGQNLDLMSYSMLALVNESKQALLDINIYTEQANRVFGTFFKHFASQNVSMKHGGNVFQSIGHNLPPDFGPVSINATEQANYRFSQPINSTTPRSGSAVLETPVQALVMSPTASWLSFGLLAFLALCTILIYSFDRKRYKDVPRDVNTLGSVLGFVYGSERLLEWAGENMDSKTWNQVGVRGGGLRRRIQDSDIQAKMGPFAGNDGKKRWGIEIVE